MITGLDEKGIETSPQWEVVRTGIRRGGRATADFKLGDFSVKDTTIVNLDLLSLAIPRFLIFRTIWVMLNVSQYTAYTMRYRLRLLLGGEEVFSRFYRNFNANYDATVGIAPNCSSTSTIGRDVLNMNYKDNNGSSVTMYVTPFRIGCTADQAIVTLDSFAGSTYGANPDARFALAILSENVRV